MDKDKLIKNHFWILAAVAALLALGSWILLIFTGPSSAAGDSVKSKNNWNKYKKEKNFKHKGWIEEMRKDADELKNDGASIHGKLYSKQMAGADMMTWPKGMKTAGFDIKDGKFAFEVEIHPPKTSPKSLPADSDTKQSGKLTRSLEEWFEIEDSKGNTVRFLRTIGTKITDKQEAAKKFERGNFGPLASYPNRMVTVMYVTGKFFGIDEFTETEKEKYRENYHQPQLAEALAALKPINAAGRPTLLFHYIRDPKLPPLDPKKDKFKIENDIWIYEEGTYPPSDNRFLPYVKTWTDKAKDIFSEEIWEAQEDIWIRRELFKQIRAANDALAHFEPRSTGKDAKPNSFRNFYWDIDFTIAEEGVSATLKNLRPHQQAIDGLHFVLRFKDKDGKPGPPVLFPPKEKPLKDNPVGPTGGGKSVFTTKRPILVNDGGQTEIYSVDQVLTVETAAVKRIDVITVGQASNGDYAVSQRQSSKPLLPYDKSKKSAAAVVFDPNDTTSPLSQLPPEMGKVSRHGVLLDRYIEPPTSESRKLPVSLVLVVGPEHISLVEASLISSPLRFLPTQVLWQRCQLTLPGPDLAKPFAGGGETQENAELAIYGVVTIYQRPGRPTWAGK